jgi:hypothetical protein
MAQLVGQMLGYMISLEVLELDHLASLCSDSGARG